MRSAQLLLFCIGCLIVVPAVWGQGTTSTAMTGILGYLDPQTGAFRPVPPAVEADVEQPAATTITGTITVTLTITIKSTGIANVNCTANVSVSDAVTTAPTFLGETNSVAATGTGTTRTCRLTIPYSWSLATPTTDNMSTSYIVFGGATATGGLPTRTSSRSPLDTRKVPANGATTPLTAAVTI